MSGRGHDVGSILVEIILTAQKELDRVTIAIILLVLHIGQDVNRKRHPCNNFLASGATTIQR